VRGAEYPSAAVPLAHPARLRAWAAAHGVGSWSGEPFRYLEIGCGNAAHLLPLATQFPRSEFVGVDLDGALIAKGRRAAEACGIGNLTLIEADVRDFAASGERFEYVVAHGVFSWVPEDARARLLALPAEVLAPLGVAYISYNTLPGWGLRGVIRDVMQDAAGGRGAGGLRAAKGRLAELKRHLVRPDHPYTRLLAAELDFALGRSDGYLAGEHLAEVNTPVHVKDFLRRAEAQGLAFVCELLSATPEGDVEHLAGELTASGMTRADAEQTLDVLVYRQLRATLLCRASVPVAPHPSFEALAQGGFFAGGLTPLAEEPLLGPGQQLVFRTHGGARIESDEPLLKAALLVLSRAWPLPLPAQRLIGLAMSSLRERGLLEGARVDAAGIRATMDDLVALARRRLIEILPWAPPVAVRIPSRPAVRPITRLEAERSPVVTSVLHEPVLLEEPLRTLVRLLDGTRDLRALVAELSDRIDAGELPISPAGAEELAGAERIVRLAEMLGRAVSRVHALGLLEIEPERAPALDAREGEPALAGGAG
jgi:SAM-dependent methyltransferase